MKEDKIKSPINVDHLSDDFFKSVLMRETPTLKSIENSFKPIIPILQNSIIPIPKQSEAKFGMERPFSFVMGW